METPRSEKTGTGTRTGLLLPILIACLIVVLAAGFLLNWKSENTALSFPTPYQAVLLSNGSVYYGKLHGYGTPHPVLTNVFYIVTRTDPKTNRTSNILVKRGHELHAPDRMYLTPRAIVFVETVGTHSKVSQLISESGGS
ncbi:MAG: hypothetical protein ACRD4O_13075 [Bryobacteraceae bacterium]